MSVDKQHHGARKEVEEDSLQCAMYSKGSSWIYRRVREFPHEGNERTDNRYDPCG